MTEHIELYKKYRPKVWADLIGQEKVAKSLQSVVIANKLPTAFGFFGDRGCGKSSAALILAKAINCENPTKGNPCNVCETCLNIDDGTQLGVNYISMANKNSVDDVRELVQQARLNQPINKQVWILDEVHNLSRQAFDALLIPIEEKTMPALFIFCSTELNKIPQTILSRIQKRRFNLIKSEDLMKLVKKVGAAENLDLTEDEYEAAVRAGGGSARDTLSALEELVETGELQPVYSGLLLDALAARNVPKVFNILAHANESNVDFKEFAEQTFEDLRDLLLLSRGVKENFLSVIPVKDPSATVKQLGGTNGILFLLKELGEALVLIGQKSDARIMFEISLLRGVLGLNKLSNQQK